MTWFLSYQTPVWRLYTQTKYLADAIASSHRANSGLLCKPEYPPIYSTKAAQQLALLRQVTIWRHCHASLLAKIFPSTLSALPSDLNCPNPQARLVDSAFHLLRLSLCSTCVHVYTGYSYHEMILEPKPHRGEGWSGTWMEAELEMHLMFTTTVGTDETLNVTWRLKPVVKVPPIWLKATPPPSRTKSGTASIGLRTS